MKKIWCWAVSVSVSLSVFLSLFPCGFSSIDNFNQAFPIIEPDPGHTKLRLAREGLEAIERITTPIAAVAVSLNSLAFYSCNVCVDHP